MYSDKMLIFECCHLYFLWGQTPNFLGPALQDIPAEAEQRLALGD